MPGMKIVVPHTLTVEEAMARIRNLLAGIKRDYGDRVSDLEERWTGDRGEFAFRAMGFAVSGTLHVRSGEVELDGQYPWAAAPFKGKIESMIRDRATQLLSS